MLVTSGTCPACGGNRTLPTAYFAATAVMLLVPMLLVAGLVIWLRRAVRARDEARLRHTRFRLPDSISQPPEEAP